MNLLVRLGIYLPVLFLIAIVVVGQHHETLQDTVRGAAKRTVRWIVWSGILVAVMLALEVLFIGW
jgi:hypothetical protein